MGGGHGGWLVGGNGERDRNYSQVPAPLRLSAYRIRNMGN